MGSVSRNLVLSLALILATCSGVLGRTENNIKTAVFLSPKFELGAGSVINRYYYGIDFPRGHIAMKSFNAEVIDEAGNPVPLHETYLHHWVVARYHQSKNHVTTHTDKSYDDGHRMLHESDDFVMVRNNGICQRNVLGQYYGLGSETRGTATHIPDPFGIEVGNPEEIPEGYEEKWMLNVHAIDTRGVEDKLGCTECRCDLYNVTRDEYDRPLRPGYVGGLLCCYDYTQCKLREGFEVESTKRSLYLRYTVKWVEWDKFVVPVKIYILDVTDTLKISDDSKVISSSDHNCVVEYEVEPCSPDSKDGKGCHHVKRTSLPMQTGGYVIYGVAHQHSGGIGSTLYGQDEATNPLFCSGLSTCLYTLWKTAVKPKSRWTTTKAKDGRVICSSMPSYGNGKEAGNEAGYIVGMSTCYPQPGSVKVFDGETVTLVSNYSSSQRHSGVMGLFYLLVAEQLPHQHFIHSTRSSFFVDVKNIIY